MEQCAGQGTECAGATFGGPNQECYLYSKMLAADAPAYPIMAAVRTSNEEGVLNRREILVNGAFDGSLSPWTSGTGNAENQFSANGNAAIVVVPPGDSNTLSQEIEQPAVGNAAYYFFMDVNVGASAPPPRRKRQAQNSPVSCQIDVQNAIGDLFYRQILGVTTAGVNTVYGSGTIRQGGVLNLVVNVQCSGTVNSVIRLDNISFFVFQPTGGSDPNCSSDTSILQNGGFDTAFPPWTTSQGSSTSAQFSVSGGQALVNYVANANTNDDLARIAQSATIPTDTSYLITADLFFTIGAGGSCDVGFGNEFEVLYPTGQITTSQALPIRYDGVSDIASSQFAITISCSGPNVSRVSIDNVALILNPGQSCSP